MSVPASDGLIGRMIANYRVAKKLGEGGMGAVYKLEHVKLKNTFKAMKVMHPQYASSGQAAQRFEQEAAVAAAIGSDRVVKVDDYGVLDDGTAYFTMEFVEGSDLADYLTSNGPLPVEKALKLIVRIADTVAVAHSKQIVHRDLKPANILLQDNFHPKVCDWGVAGVSGDGKIVHTQENAIVGTRGYISPEAATGRPTDGRTDIFSLGVITYELLTGRLPYPQFSPMEFSELADFLMRPAPTVASARPPTLDSIPAMLEETVARAIAKEPNNRYSRMVDFRDDIVKCLTWMAEHNGAVRPAMMTMLSQKADSAGPQPTMRTPAGFVDQMIQDMRALTPQPTPTVNGYGRQTSTPPQSGIVPTLTPQPVSYTMPPPASRQNTALMATMLVLLLSAFGVAGWLVFGRQSAAVALPPSPDLDVGRVLISTVPSGALVTVDGTVLGAAPTILSARPGDTKQVHVSLAGYGDADESVVVAKNDRKVEIRLVPTVSAPTAVPLQASAPPHAPAVDKKHASRAHRAATPGQTGKKGAVADPWE